MASRSRFRSNMEYATRELEKHYELYKGDFLKFFPELLGFVGKA